MKTKVIEIQVHGFTGDGKSNVCRVIKDALIKAYGPHTQVASRLLSEEPDSDNGPRDNVIFVVEEFNHGSWCARKDPS